MYHPPRTIVIVRCTLDFTLVRNGSRDPTTRVTMVSDHGPNSAMVERATLTPCGPGAIQIRVIDGHSEVVGAWGPGGPWLAEHGRRLAASDPALIPTDPLIPRHRALEQAHRMLGALVLPATDTPYHEIVPAILGQRVTAAQALHQWASLCLRYGEPAPGPLGLHLPPHPDRLRAIPSWEFHRLGVEKQRAATLQTAARYANFIDATRRLSGIEARERLVALPGIGVWTAAVTVGVSHGDPDALPVGDFHVKNTVAWALTGAPRGTDDEMLNTLSDYAGQRWRVVRMLEKSGHSAPRFGPKRRLLNVARL